MRDLGIRLLFSFACLAACASAQTKSPAPAGTVSGHVFLADSDRPARFATIYLKSVKPPDSSDDFFSVLMNSAIQNMQGKQNSGSSSSSDDAARELQSAKAAASGFLSSVTDAMLSATIAADGSYRFPGVPPGTYFVHVKAPGYVDPLTLFTPDELASTDPAVRKRVFAAIPTVTLAGSEHVREDLRLTRGAALTGRLHYADGSPAPGWAVTAIALHGTTAPPPVPTVFGIDLGAIPITTRLDRTTTDDTGQFRIAGLPTGDYVVEARLNTAALDREPFAPVASTSGSFLSILGGLSGLSGLRLVTYSGQASRLSLAETIPLRAGEERIVPDLVVTMEADRTVSGVVVAASDGHPINDGTVQLLAQTKDGRDDPSLTLSATIHPDGTFRFDYVPAPGKYTLRALHASDSTTAAASMKLLGSLIAERKALHNYLPTPVPIELQDDNLTDLRIPLTDFPTAAASR